MVRDRRAGALNARLRMLDGLSMGSRLSRDDYARCLVTLRDVAEFMSYGSCSPGISEPLRDLESPTLQGSIRDCCKVRPINNAFRCIFEAPSEAIRMRYVSFSRQSSRGLRSKHFEQAGTLAFPGDTLVMHIPVANMVRV